MKLNFQSDIKELGTNTFRWIVLGVLILIPVLLISWYVNHFELIHPWLQFLQAAAVWVVGLSLLLSLIPKIRKITGKAIIYSSWISGGVLWLLNIYTSVTLLGLFWTILGLCFFGAGVLITSGIGLLINGYYGNLGIMIIWAVAIFVVRGIGIMILEKSTAEE